MRSPAKPASITRTLLHPRRSPVLIALFILCLTCVIYLPAIRGGYIWDDDYYITNNEHLKTVAGLKKLWTDPTIGTNQYYPLTMTSFWIEYQLWGLRPLGYHLVNVLLHSANALLLYLILKRMKMRSALFIALLFAVHPVHVESVAWITERKNTLSGFFFLASLLAYLRFSDSAPTSTNQSESAERRHRLLLYGIALLLFVAALLSKTIACSLPVVILLLNRWRRPFHLKREILPILPFLAIGLILGLVTIWVERNYVKAEGAEWNISFVGRCLIAGRALLFYAAKLIVPTRLSFTYPRWNIDPSTAWHYLFPGFVIMSVIALFVARKRIGNGPLLTVCAFMVMLFPCLGFINIYPMRYTFVADHYQYLGSIALLILYAECLYLLIDRIPGNQSRRRFMNTAGLALILVLCFLTWKQTRIYKNLETLWRDTISKNPSSWMAHNNLGSILVDRGDYLEAKHHLETALQLKHDYELPYHNLGDLYRKQGEYEAAISMYRAAITNNRFYAGSHNNLGVVYATIGQVDSADSVWSRAVRLFPTDDYFRKNLEQLRGENMKNRNCDR